MMMMLMEMMAMVVLMGLMGMEMTSVVMMVVVMGMEMTMTLTTVITMMGDGDRDVSGDDVSGTAIRMVL